MDKSAKVWDTRMNSCLATLLGHDDEVLDLAFDNNGRKLATASSDCSARVWNISGNFQQLALMQGHREEVSKGKSLSREIPDALMYVTVLDNPGNDRAFQSASARTAVNC